VNASPIIGLDVHSWRFDGVTQRIALCYFAAAILVLWSNRRGAFIAMCVCLLGYWALLRFAPVPSFGMPGRDIPFMDPDRNLAAWLDRKLFMGHLFDKTRDPEGLLGTIPSIATTLIGVLTGYWLQSQRSPGAKALRMLYVGILGLVAGEVWNLWFPINKNLWTSSYVVFTAGMAAVTLAVCIWLIENENVRWWTPPFLAFGMNPIVAFVGSAAMERLIYSVITLNVGGKTVSLETALYNATLGAWLPPQLASLTFAVCFVLLWLGVLTVLYRRQIFVKI
jgi:predicted acyltransferase